MPSPFPGMDPYLEDPTNWADFHHTFITYWREAIAAVLPRHYQAKINEQLSLVELPAADRRAAPDLTVSRPATMPDRRPGAPVGAATLEPVTLEVEVLEQPVEAYIEIIRRPDRTVVTVLELLSPANKNNPGRGTYLAKRNALIQQDVHLVEVDLLRGGQRVPIRGDLPAGDYYAYISRGDRRPACDVYSWTIRQPLPTLPVPLKAPDPNVHVSLANVFATAYERGGYADDIDYTGAVSAPIRPEDRAWAAEQVRATRG